MDRLEHARKLYTNLGVDIEAAMDTLRQVPISIHCWQGDDVQGFEHNAALSGGIAVTGNYPNRARDGWELMNDLDQALELIPGKHRINLHAMYAISRGETNRSELTPEHFKPWVEFAQERGMGLDFNPTLFSHPMANDGLTLSHPDKDVRRYWINHCKATREIAAYFGATLKTPSLHNIWVPDGFKDTPADRTGPRMRLKESLDEIFFVEYDPAYIADSVESKLFGIGLESYTVGSHEFYMMYAARQNILCLLDSGHFHPLEQVSDKISAMLLFSEKLALHITRGVRWDSDHVVTLDDELKAIAHAVVSCNALDRVMIGLDYFDASINRVAAWVVGVRNMQKALLYALLFPNEMLGKAQDEADYTKILVMTEELKSYPFGDVWDHFCTKAGVCGIEGWYDEVKKYETNTKR
jgi:L-rhamnose isomerase